MPNLHDQYLTGRMSQPVGFDWFGPVPDYVPQPTPPRTIITLAAEQKLLNPNETQQWFTSESAYRIGQRRCRMEFDYNTWITFDEYVAILFTGHPGCYVIKGI